MDLKTLYRQNFLVLAQTLHQRREVLGAMISAVAEDSIIRLSEYSIHLLEKTRTPSGILYHVRVIDNKTDRCVLQGPVMLPVARKTKPKTASKEGSNSEPSEAKQNDPTRTMPGYNRYKCSECGNTVQVAKKPRAKDPVVLCGSSAHAGKNISMGREVPV